MARNRTRSRLLGPSTLGILAIAFALAGLGRAQVTVNMAVTTGPNANAAQAIAPMCEAQNPGIDVNLIENPWNEIDTRQVLDFTAGEGNFDIVMQSNSFFGSYAAAGYLEPLGPYFENAELVDAEQFDLEDFNRAVLDAVGSYQGELYALPYMYFPQITVYRQDLLAEIGAQVPTTLDEYLDVVRRLDELGTVHGTSVVGIKAGAGGNVYAWAPFLFNFGGSFADAEGNPTLNSEAAVQALEYYTQLFEHSPSEAINYGTDQVTSAFGAGDIGIMLMDADNAAALLDPSYTELTREQVGFAPIPSGPAGAPGRPLLGAWSIGLSRLSDNKEEAFRIMTCLLSSDPTITSAFVQHGINPRVSVLREYADEYPNYAVVAEELESVGAIPAIPAWLQIEDALANAISNALLGVQSPQEALDQAQRIAEAAAQ